MIVAEDVTKRGSPRTAARGVNGAAKTDHQLEEAVEAKVPAPIPQPLADLPPGLEAFHDEDGKLFISSSDDARNNLVRAGGSSQDGRRYRSFGRSRGSVRRLAPRGSWCGLA